MELVLDSAVASLATRALRLYDLPSGASAQLVCNSENETYKVSAPQGGPWALRVQRPGYQSKNALASEIAWLAALRKDGIAATPIPIAGRDGEWVQTVALHPGTLRNVVLFAWEHGEQPTMAPTMTDDLRDCFFTLGAIAANMHAHGSQWSQPVGFERFAWNFETTLGERPRWGSWQAALGMNAIRINLFTQVVERIRRRLAAYGSGPDRFGLIHGDLRLANLLTQHGTVKVIDFDDCGFGWYMYDLAAVLSFHEHLPAVPDLISALLRSYRTVKSVTQAEEDELPTFLMLRRLMLIAWIGSHPEADLAQTLGEEFTDQTVGLCNAYLVNQAEP